MNRCTALFALAALLTPLAGPALAGIDQGDNEVAIFGSYTIGDEGVDDTVVLAGRFGRFVTPEISAGGNLVYAGTTGGSDFSVIFLSGDARYHLVTESLAVPYAGLQLGLARIEVGSDDEIGYSYGAMAGVKYFLTEDTTFFGEFNYLVAVIDGTGTDQKMFNIGLSHLF